MAWARSTKPTTPRSKRTVAIKVLAKQDEDASARLLQEARAASALNHPHICTIHEVGEHEGQAFIVMEHVEGKPLSALIPADGLPPESVIRYGTHIADALAHAHERGIVHRDLKSANVVITPEGRAKLKEVGAAGEQSTPLPPIIQPAKGQSHTASLGSQKLAAQSGGTVMKHVLLLLVLGVLVCGGVAPASAQATVERNVVYGMYSGLALLMDVHRPADPNGYGIVVIPGSGWHMALALDTRRLSQRVSADDPRTQALLDGGYTLFAINHRAAPRFRYPAAVEDAQRAVRFVRHHAATYGIDPDRIGAYGGSSGGHLVSMLGVTDGNGHPDDESPINRHSSKVQAVVALYPATDLGAFASGPDGDKAAPASFVGTRPSRNPQSAEALLYAEASPVFHVSPDDPPVLLVHGDADTVVPFSQSELFQEALAKSGVIVDFIRVPGGGHGRALDVPNAPDYIGAMVEWFDQHLPVH